MRHQSGRSRVIAGSLLVAVALATFIGLTNQAPAATANLPTVVVLATGGTIAGAAASDVQAAYTSGQVGVEQLLAAVPQAARLAVLRGEQIANIGSLGLVASMDLNPQKARVLLRLALLRPRRAVDTQRLFSEY